MANCFPSNILVDNKNILVAYLLHIACRRSGSKKVVVCGSYLLDKRNGAYFTSSRITRNAFVNQIRTWRGSSQKEAATCVRRFNGWFPKQHSSGDMGIPCLISQVSTPIVVLFKTAIRVEARSIANHKLEWTSEVVNRFAI